MKDLRRNEFIDMLEMAEILYEAKDKFIKCDIPSLGAVTYYPKADKLQIDKNNHWEEGGFTFVKQFLSYTENEIRPIQQATSLVKVREVKSDEELRDDFAMRAMQGFLSNEISMVELEQIVRGSKRFNSTIDYIANLSYEYADAMMKQRKLKTE
jgi:hypothetical protein